MNARNDTRTSSTATSSSRPAQVRTWRRILFGVCLLGLAGGAAWSLWPSPPTLPVLGQMKLPGNLGWPLAMSPDGSLLVTSNAKNGVTIWDLKTKTIKARSTETSWAIVGPISPDGRTLVVRCNNTPRGGVQLKALDTADGSVRSTLDLPQPFLVDMKFSEDGSRFLATTSPQPYSKSKSDSWEIRSWNASDWTEGSTRTLPIPASPCAAVSWDGRLAASWDPAVGKISLWDLTVDPPTETVMESKSPTEQIFSMRFSPDDRTLSVGKSHGPTELWDIASRTRTKAFPPFSSGYASRIIAFSPDQKTLFTQESPDPPRNVLRKIGYILNWAVHAGQYEGPPPCVIVRDIATGRVRAAMKDQFRPVISHDGKVLATASSDGTLTLWDLSNSQP
jgi:WD40 repeat protein